MTSLSRRLHLSSRLAASITRLEAPRHRPRHAPRRDRVQGNIVATVAWPRFLVWHSYLASRKPTKASMERAAHRLRGEVLWRIMAWMHRHGTLPAKIAEHAPSWVLREPPHVTRQHKRVSTPTVTRADDGDPADWWDEYWAMYGDDFDVGQFFDAIPPDDRAQFNQEAYASVGASIAESDFQDWLQNTVLSDLQVLQILESYWNGNASSIAGQETLGEMGIAGDFDLVDPFTDNFLRYQAGVFVGGQTNRINESTREQLAEALSYGWGGATDQGLGPLSVDQLARYVQTVMDAWGNELAGMSRNRALMIANTETARAETFGQFVSMLGSGVQYKQWMTTVGACSVCADNELQGPQRVVVGILDTFPSGHYSPPAHPMCLPAGVYVGGPKAIGASMRSYSGTMISIHTGDGHQLSLTPNHPVWTMTGWCAAQDLCVGDWVGTWPMGAETRIAQIEEVASRMVAYSRMLPEEQTVDVTQEMFHGDGIPGTRAIIQPSLAVSREHDPPCAGFTNIIAIHTYQFDGPVYNLETEDGWYAANGIAVHNCRCSLAPWVDETKPFNPTQWMNAPSADQLQRLFNDPSFAQWPNKVVDLSDPALQLVPPPPTALGDFGKLQYSQLPQALQDVIDPQKFADNYTDAWNVMIRSMGQAVNDAAQADAAVKQAEESVIYGGGGPATGGVIKLDDLLAQLDDGDLADADSAIADALDQALSQLPENMRSWNDGLGNSGNTGNETGGS